MNFRSPEWFRFAAAAAAADKELSKLTSTAAFLETVAAVEQMAPYLAGEIRPRGGEGL